MSEVFLRGAESNFTAVYVDGVRMNNPANNRGGSFDWSTMAVNEIERIDVAVGSMSAIHGSDAMAGVVRIETAWPQPGQVAAYTEIGSDQAWRAGVAGSLGVGETASAGVRVSTLDAGTAIEGSRLELDSFAARLAGVHHGDDAWRLGVRVIDRRRSSYPEVSGGPRYAVLDVLEHADGSEVGLSGSGEWTVAERWQTELAANWRRLEDDSRTPPVAPGLLDGQPGYTSDSEHERAQLQWINRVGLGADSGVAFGLDVVEEDGRDDGTLDLGFAVLPNTYRMERSTRSGFLEWGHAWPAGFSSTLALRRDGGTEESRSSGALGLARAFGSVDGRAWARVANGFKLPSFFALGNPLYGNPDLEPEQVRSVELGYDQTFEGGARPACPCSAANSRIWSTSISRPSVTSIAAASTSTACTCTRSSPWQRTSGSRSTPRCSISAAPPARCDAGRKTPAASTSAGSRRRCGRWTPRCATSTNA